MDTWMGGGRVIQGEGTGSTKALWALGGGVRWENHT